MEEFKKYLEMAMANRLILDWRVLMVEYRLTFEQVRQCIHDVYGHSAHYVEPHL